MARGVDEGPRNVSANKGLRESLRGKSATDAAKAIARARHNGDPQLVGRADSVQEIKEIRGSREAERLGHYAGSGAAAMGCRMAMARLRDCYPGYEAEVHERRNEYRVLFFRTA